MKENTVTIKLEYPVKLVDCELKEVIMRRPSLKDSLDHEQDGTLKAEVKLMSALTEINIEDLTLLDMEDYGKLQDELLRFQGVDPKNLRKGTSL